LVSGAATFSDNVLLSATKKLYLSGTSYIQEVAAGMIRLAPSGNDSFDITSTYMNVWVPSSFYSTISANAGSDLRLYRPDSSYPSTSWYWNIYMDSSNLLSFAVNGGTPKMVINASGNVLIGSTINDARFKVTGATSDSSANAVYVENSSLAGLFLIRNDGLFFVGTSANSPYNNALTGRTPILAASGVLGYLSSTRESKGNIKSINNIDFINQLNPVQFNYRKKNNDTNKFTDELEENITYGFIADEVEKVNKELVFYNEDGTLAGVEYNSMIAILTKAIQEQQAIITSLQDRLTKGGL
jgi:hypothetical protein